MSWRGSEYSHGNVQPYCYSGTQAAACGFFSFLICSVSVVPLRFLVLLPLRDLLDVPRIPGSNDGRGLQQHRSYEAADRRHSTQLVAALERAISTLSPQRYAKVERNRKSGLFRLRDVASVNSILQAAAFRSLRALERPAFTLQPLKLHTYVIRPRRPCRRCRMPLPLSLSCPYCNRDTMNAPPRE